MNLLGKKQKMQKKKLAHKSKKKYKKNARKIRNARTHLLHCVQLYNIEDTNYY